MEARTAQANKALDDLDNELISSGTVRDLSFVFAPKRGDEGSWLIGKLADVSSRQFEKQRDAATVLHFGSCASKSPGRDWIAHRESSLVCSEALRLRMNPKMDVGVVFAIRFDGFEKSEKEGREDYRTFTVVVQTDARLAQILSTATAE